jgi:acyl-CoA thioester hydrolase
VVFYANYLKFFERARTEWMRTLGFGQERMRLETGAVFVVSNTAVRYLQPARLDDLLRVTVRQVQAARASITLDQQAWRGESLLAESTIRIACVDATTFQLRRIPDDVAAAVTSVSASRSSVANQALKNDRLKPLFNT